jgi:uncharacterized coiled-coil DUF342 family protein
MFTERIDGEKEDRREINDMIEERKKERDRINNKGHVRIFGIFKRDTFPRKVS